MAGRKPAARRVAEPSAVIALPGGRGFLATLLFSGEFIGWDFIEIAWVAHANYTPETRNRFYEMRKKARPI